MRVVAYLFNRYPETTLTTLRREIDAVEETGIEIYRFAHRPSLQPFASDADRDEAMRTQYLATGGVVPLIPAVVRACLRDPIRFFATVRIMLQLRPLSLRHFAYLAMACQLVEHTLSVRAEHLHTHFAQNAAAVAMLARSLGGPPWTMTVHGPEDLEPCHLQSLVARARSADATIAISRWAAGEIRKNTAPDIIDAHVVGMGVNRLFLQPPVPIKSTTRIVCIARLERRKGQDVLIEAIDLLHSRGITATVDLVGDGPCKDELLSQINRLGLASQLRICGWLTEEGVRNMLDRSSIAVLPSHAEGLPVSIMEAFARARPVVATDVAGISELVHNNTNGALVAAGDTIGLALALETLLAKLPSELFEMGLRGRAEVEERHDARKNGQALAKVWQSIAN